VGVGDSHDNLLFFTDAGKVYHLRAFDVPDSKRASRGVFITNLIDMDQSERVTTIVTVRDYSRDYMLLATSRGVVKKTLLADFEEVRRNGKIAMRLDDGDTLIAARLATNESNIMMVS